MVIFEENFKWHLEAFVSELFEYSVIIHHPHVIPNIKTVDHKH